MAKAKKPARAQERFGSEGRCRRQTGDIGILRSCALIARSEREQAHGGRPDSPPHVWRRDGEGH